MTDTKSVTHDGSLPPNWALTRPKGLAQHAWDLIGAPLRMVLLPDTKSEGFHLTSLRAERYGAVLPHLQGRLLDIGAGDNTLIKLYQADLAARGISSDAARESVGVDVVDWGGEVTLIKSSDALPFPDESFDSVAFIACLNHIPERIGAMKEAWRVLRPGGVLVSTMIGRLVGDVGHAIWWYSEDKHREIDPGEVMGLDKSDMIDLYHQGGFDKVDVHRFVYGLNYLFVAKKA